MQPAQWRIAGILPVSLPRHQNEIPWQLLLAQPEHRVLERLGRSSPAIAQLAHRFSATCSATNFEDTPMRDSSDIPTIVSAQNP